MIRITTFSLMMATMAAFSFAQQGPIQQSSKERCAVNVVGNNNRVFTCSEMDEKTASRILSLLNQIAATQGGQRDAVMAKLDEILKAVNPNMPTKTYFCNGQWKTSGPGANAGFEINMGGDDSVFQEMVRLNNSAKYADLLKLCLAQMQSAPEWLTPLLFCGASYLAMGDKEKARSMLAEFDSRTGPAYGVDGCKQASDYLHSQLP